MKFSHTTTLHMENIISVDVIVKSKDIDSTGKFDEFGSKCIFTIGQGGIHVSSGNEDFIRALALEMLKATFK